MSNGFSNWLKLSSCGTSPIMRIASLRSRADRRAEDARLAAGRVDQRGKDADQRRLAGAVRAEQGEEIAGLDGQRDALEGFDAVRVGLAQLDDVERWGLGHGVGAGNAVRSRRPAIITGCPADRSRRAQFQSRDRTFPAPTRRKPHARARRAPHVVRARRRQAVRVRARASSCRSISTTPTASRPSAAIRSRRSAMAARRRSSASRSRCRMSKAARRPRSCPNLDEGGTRRRERPVRPLLPDGRRHEPRATCSSRPAPASRRIARCCRRSAKLIATRGCTFALVYGARNEGELLYGEEFEAFAREMPGFTFHPCFSRAMPRAMPRPNDRSGRVQVALGELAARTRRTTSRICAAIRTWSIRRSRC